MKKFLVLSPLFLVVFTGCTKQGGVAVPTGAPTPTPPVAKEKGGEKMEPSGKKILMIVAPTNFRDEEFEKPKVIFEQAQALVTVASKGVSEATGMLGAKAAVDKDISEVSAAEYDAVVFIGGSGASVYFNDPQAQALAKDAFSQGKVVGAICIAPSTLANAGILAGKRATCFFSESGNLRNKGATYTGEPVTVDGKIVTASGPEAAEAFGEKIIEILSQP